MGDTAPSLKLSADGAMKVLHAAMDKAAAMGVPQCISVVDPGGHLLAFVRMDGAYALSYDSSLKKAMTAAIYGQPTGHIEAGIDIKLALATEGKRINLPGGPSSTTWASAAKCRATHRPTPTRNATGAFTPTSPKP